MILVMLALFKTWATDQIRDELLELGIQLNDDKNSSLYELF